METGGERGLKGDSTEWAEVNQSEAETRERKEFTGDGTPGGG